MQHVSMIQSVVPKQSANAPSGQSNARSANTSDDASFADAVSAHDKQGNATGSKGESAFISENDKVQMEADKNRAGAHSGGKTGDGVDLDAESLGDSSESEAEALMQSSQLLLEADAGIDTELNLALGASQSKSDGSVLAHTKGNESLHSILSSPRSTNGSMVSADLVAGKSQLAAGQKETSGNASATHPDRMQASLLEAKVGSPVNTGFSKEAVNSAKPSAHNHKLISQSELLSQPNPGALKSVLQQKAVPSATLNEAVNAITLRDVIRSQNAPSAPINTSTASMTGILAESSRPPSAQGLTQMSMARIVTLQAAREKTTQIYVPEDGLTSLRTSDSSGLSAQDPRASVVLETGNVRPAAMFPASMPRQIGTAMAQILSSSKPGSEIELRLHPEELGRLKMRLAISDGAITVNILAERPEIGDMLRRQIAVLSRELSSSGFEDVAFNFEEGFERQDNSKHQESEPALNLGTYEANPETGEEPERMAEATPLVMLYADGGIDIRL